MAFQAIQKIYRRKEKSPIMSPPEKMTNNTAIVNLWLVPYQTLFLFTCCSPPHTPPSPLLSASPAWVSVCVVFNPLPWASAASRPLTLSSPLLPPPLSLLHSPAFQFESHLPSPRSSPPTPSMFLHTVHPPASGEHGPAPMPLQLQPSHPCPCHCPPSTGHISVLTRWSRLLRSRFSQPL